MYRIKQYHDFIVFVLSDSNLFLLYQCFDMTVHFELLAKILAVLYVLIYADRPLNHNTN